MGWRFRRSIKIGKHTRLNLGKKGMSISTGVKGARVTVNNKGRVTRTVGIPGTGIYNTKQYKLKSTENRITEKQKQQYPLSAILFGIVFGITLFSFLMGAIGFLTGFRIIVISFIAVIVYTVISEIRKDEKLK